MLREFRDFVMRGNVVELAVAEIIAAVVFFFVVRPMNALMARLKRPDEEPDAPSAEVATLLEIRDLLAGQRGGGVA